MKRVNIYLIILKVLFDKLQFKHGFQKEQKHKKHIHLHIYDITFSFYMKLMMVLVT